MLKADVCARLSWPLWAGEAPRRVVLAVLLAVAVTAPGGRAEAAPAPAPTPAPTATPTPLPHEHSGSPDASSAAVSAAEPAAVTSPTPAVPPPDATAAPAVTPTPEPVSPAVVPEPVPEPAGDAAGGAAGAAAEETAEPAAVEPPQELPEPAPVQQLAWRPGDECELSHAPADGVERSQQLLLETFCEATLWFDGLFGGEPDVANARNVAGRVEVSALHTEMWGTETDVRLRLNYDLPTLERRLKLFLGRGDRDEFVSDRREGLAVRSSVFAVENEDRWLAGLGWSPPGRYKEKIDFRVGGNVSSSPEVFIQGRYRQNVFVGEGSVWRLRETVFYENRDGFGSTTGIDFDHVLRNDVLFRFSNIGTWSEGSEGLEWRSTGVLYRNLLRSRAAAAELFARGATGAPVELREYGGRLIYRHPLRRQSLFAEVVGGYSFPRELPGTRREGSAMVGVGLELLFGRDPF